MTQGSDNLLGPTEEGPVSNRLGLILTSGWLFWAVVLAATAGAIAMGALSEGRGFFDKDEVIYQRVTERFGEGISGELIRTYDGEPASPAPLFFVVYSAWGKVFGFEYSSLRSLSLVITLITMGVLWFYIGRLKKRGGRDYFGLLVFIFPYIFCMGFAVMAEPLTLLLTVVGICCFVESLDSDKYGVMIAGSLSIAAAMYVRVHAVFVCPALMAALFMSKDRSVGKWALAAAPILLRVPLFLFQGGMTVSREAFVGTKPELGFVLANLNFSMVWLGYMFLPLLWWCKRPGKISVAAVLLLTIFYFVFCPDYLSTAHNGALRSLLLWANVDGVTASWVLLPAWVVGCYILVDMAGRILSGVSAMEVLLSCCVFAFMCQLVFSTADFERYYQLVVPAVVLVGVERRRTMGGYSAFAVWHLLFMALAGLRLYKSIG